MPEFDNIKIEATRRNGFGEVAGSSESILSLIAGAFSEAVALIWKGDEGHYLSAPNGRRQIWHAWLSQQDLAKLSENHRSLMMKAKGKELVRDAFGDVPRGIIRALAHMGPIARAPAFYLSLVKILLADGEAATYLRHAEMIDDAAVTALSCLDSRISPDVAVGLFKSEMISTGSAKALDWSLERLRNLAGDSAVDSVLRSNSLLDSFRSAMIVVAFPKAPFAFPSGDLRPVTTAQRLRELARQQQNCLTCPHRFWAAVTSVLNNRQFFYEWTGEAPALLLLARAGGLGWVVKDARTSANLPINFDQRRAIGPVLSSFPEICPSWPEEGFPIFIDEVLDWSL